MSDAPCPNEEVTHRDLEFLDRLISEHWQAHSETHLADQRTVEQARMTMEQRLDAMNEFRASLTDVVNRTISRELFDQRAESVDARIGALERSIVGREVFNREIELRDAQIDILMEFRSRAVGIGVAVSLFSGLVGAIVMRVVSGA